MSKAINFLKAHEVKTEVRLEDRAKWRSDNSGWLLLSQRVSIAIFQYMHANNLTRNELAAKLDVTPQYVSKLLSGKNNFTFEKICELKEKLQIESLNISI